ncbi:MAG: poly-gamma-glutamate system protein [Candidatus Aminicenantales bacterium]
MLEEGKGQKNIIYFFLLSFFFYILARYVPPALRTHLISEMKEASVIMAAAVKEIRSCEEDKGIRLDYETDINRTGLIGLKNSPLTTSLGSLPAKRTTANPNFAALLVYLLKKAGVSKGDVFAVGASSSFPALIVATLAAARAVGARALMINSLGASQWGANNPHFNWLDIQDCVLKKEIFEEMPLAVSLGGGNDTGGGISSEMREALIEIVKKMKIRFIQESDLRKNVGMRMKIYEQYAGGKKIKAFVNIGGNAADLGTDSRILKLKPGLNRIRNFPPPEKSGIIHEMAGRGVPVIHLLYIRGLASRYRLAWDPSPLPQPGEGEIYRLAAREDMSFLLIAFLYFASTLAMFLLNRLQMRSHASL